MSSNTFVLVPKVYKDGHECLADLLRVGFTLGETLTTGHNLKLPDTYNVQHESLVFEGHSVTTIINRHGVGVYWIIGSAGSSQFYLTRTKPEMSPKAP